MEQHKKMVQYSVWANCNNNCDFCLRKERDFYTLEEQIVSLKKIEENIDYVNWNEFSYGISLLGGELFYIKNELLKSEFIKLIDKIIEKILIKSKYSNAKISCVTNGIYEPSFLLKVLDRIEQKVGVGKLDLNFSYDLKYRYKSEIDRLQVLKNINLVHHRYKYGVGVQMIVTQYLIDQIKTKKFNVHSFIESQIDGNKFSLLYPHPIHTGKILNDFQFSRKDLLWFLNYLRSNDYGVYLNFIYSTKNSGTFKYTGLKDKRNKMTMDVKQLPVLSDGKEILNSCGHSTLYQCYSDSAQCLLCDIQNFDNLAK